MWLYHFDSPTPATGYFPFQETVKLQNSAIDASSRALAQSLSRFLKDDVKQMKDTKGYFNKISNDRTYGLGATASNGI
jgi:hypothetical protein